jgi:hypothetical protein
VGQGDPRGQHQAGLKTIVIAPMFRNYRSAKPALFEAANMQGE